ncbi:MAG TPA: hypothetical protein VFE51_22115 [Verrucomicrobiae bacterium]|nr:hypothetical protein [Verrucomicrobiae bacterium]
MNSDRAPYPAGTFCGYGRGLFQFKVIALACWLVCAGAGRVSAAIQFDVFLGYDGLIPEACWFPIVCEVKNDGPSFTGTVEVKGGYNQDQSLLTTIELPTSTLKRFVLPVFSNGRGYATWDVRLLDERGKVRSEQLGLRARKQLAQGAPLLGALPRTPGGTPIIRAIAARNSDLQPVAARMLTSIFPDNPLVLEGMNALYLNSERAADLTINQVDALLGWLNAGGHLIVAVEQPSDITSASWLRNIFPCDVRDLRTLPRHSELQDWLRSATWVTSSVRSSRMPNQFGNTPDDSETTVTNPFPDLADDFDFEGKEMQVAVSQLRDGKVDVAAGDTPLIVTAQRGRGRLTALLFSPEREPMRSWRELPTFWAKLAEVPGAWYRSKEMYSVGGWSTDGVFGAMIDSRQVHKLPVGWLLLLLLVYLVVIGPFDQFWLKRIGKPMLTWITFPCYVVLFSLVIYFIGYKLRAGESEWNELHVVDVLQNGTRAELRGRTYSSVYSPANQRYNLANQQKFATLRGEMSWNNSSTGERTTIFQTGDGFKAEIFVPVWTSELLVSDWWQSAPLPVMATVHSTGDGWDVHIENKSSRKLTNVQLAIEDRLLSLGAFGPEESKTQTVARRDATPLKTFVANYGGNFPNAVSSRQRAIGSTASGQIADKPDSAIAVSFIAQLSRSQMYQNAFVATPGLELSPVLEHGGAVLLAWAEGYAPIKPIEQFSPRRSQRDTLWRLALKVE